MPTGIATDFDVDNNTGGGSETVVIYDGPARVQQRSMNKDKEGISFNPTAEVSMLVQLRRDEGWADDFSNPTDYNNARGARKVLRGWRVVVTDGGMTPGLEEEMLFVDAMFNSNFEATVDLMCTNVLEAEVD